jgi:hypothetical protein
MILDFSTAGEVNIDMIPYIQKVINFPGKDYGGAIYAGWGSSISGLPTY